MHWIQRHTLKELAFSDGKRYTDLKPDTVDGNLFQYHAKQLVAGDLIIRTSDGYRLSENGKTFVTDLSQAKLMNSRRLAQSVVMIACRDQVGQFLLFKWRRHPYRGLVSLPFGRQLAGNTSSFTAKEQLLLKIGYEADLKFAGVVDIISGGQSNVNHRVCQIFFGTNLQPIASPDGLTGSYYWGNPTDIQPTSATPGFREIIRWINNPDREMLLELDQTFN